MNAVLDAGNTRIKIGFFEQGQLLKQWTTTDLEEAIQVIIAQPNCKKLLISSVSLDPQKIIQGIEGKLSVKILGHSTPLPFHNHYGTKATLGKDRMAAVAGAMQLYPNTACLVIDAGTCITYDYLDAKGNYLGGSISPGMQMRFKAMNAFTKSLPMISSYTAEAPLIGNSTTSALESGVINGMKAELNGIIARYEEEMGRFKVIICGGDAYFFESSAKAPIFVVPELVLIGLNAILEQNEV